MKVVSPTLTDDDKFLDAVQRLGSSGPVEGGEVLVDVVDAAEEIAISEVEGDTQSTEGEDKDRSFVRRVVVGMDDSAEELGKKIMLDFLPSTAKKGAVIVASGATFAAYGKEAAPALKAILGFVISIIG